jgi:hypothetical protein
VAEEIHEPQLKIVGRAIYLVGRPVASDTDLIERVRRRPKVIRTL